MKTKGKAYKAIPKASKDFALVHWGILGQKWHHRRYQNPDGSWTEEGKARRREREGEGRLSRKERKFQELKEKAIKNGDVNFAYKNRYKFTAEDYDRLEAVVNEKLKYSELKRRSDAVKYNKLQQISSIMNMSLSTANNALNLANNITKLSNNDNNSNNSSRTTRIYEQGDDDDFTMTGLTKQYTQNGTKYTDTYKYRKKEKGE